MKQDRLGQMKQLYYEKNISNQGGCVRHFQHFPRDSTPRLEAAGAGKGLLSVFTAAPYCARKTIPPPTWSHGMSVPYRISAKRLR